MTLTGIALLPPPDVSKRLVAFQHAHPAEIAGPQLGLSENLPHVTVLQCPLRPTLDKRATLAGVADRLADADPVLTIGPLYYQPTAWIFAPVSPGGGWLLDLQSAAVELCRGHLDRAGIPPPDVGMTEPERAAHLAFGYRYLGPCYRPHVTLGRTPGRVAALAPGLAAAFASAGMVGLSFRATALVFYRAGESGCCAETLARVEL